MGDESGFHMIGLLENTPRLLRSLTSRGLNVQLYNFHAAGVSSRPHPSSQNSISSEATGSLSSDVVCRSWHRGTCSSAYSSCMFLNFDLLLFTLLNKHVILLHYYDVSDRLFAIHRLVNVRYKP